MIVTIKLVMHTSSSDTNADNAAFLVMTGYLQNVPNSYKAVLEGL